MNPSILIALLQQVVIPEVTAVVRAHHNATGNLPTDAEVLAALNIDADKGITIGEAWLAAHAGPTSTV